MRLPAVIGDLATLTMRMPWRAKPTAEATTFQSQLQAQMAPDLITSDTGLSEVPECPFVLDPDYQIWAPGLRPVGLEDRGLTLEAWAAKIAGSSWPEGEEPDPDDYERVRRLLMIVGDQDYPSSVPWQDKWIHFPDRDDIPMPVMISDNDVEDDGSDEELRLYLRVGDPVLIEEPIVEEVHTALGRGLRATAYSPIPGEDEGNIAATLAYVWRVEWPDGDVSIVRLYAMYERTRVQRAADDIHALAMTLRIGEA